MFLCMYTKAWDNPALKLILHYTLEMNEAPPTLRQYKVPDLAAVSPGPTFTVKASFGASRNIDLRSPEDHKYWTASTSTGHDLPPLPTTVHFLAESGTHLFCHLHIWESRRRASPHCFALLCGSSKVWSMKAWLQTSGRRITFPHTHTHTHTSLQPDLPGCVMGYGMKSWEVGML